MAKKKKLWILVSALAVVLAAAVTAGALFLPGIFGWDRSAADPYVKWYSEETTEYVITTADQLYDMAYLSSKYDFEGQTFVLGADIVINEGDANQWLENAPSRLWYPIKGFAGTFDGQGHTISGLYSKVFNEDAGLFSETHRLAVVKNLKIVNSLIVSHGEHPAGFVSANGAGTFDTIYTDGILWSDNWNNGGIMGAVTANGDSLFTNCWFDGKMILKSDQGRVAGGIVGDIMMENGVCTVEHCLSTGTFSAEAITNTSRGRLMDIGGLVGRASGGTTNITGCFANTNIDSWCLEGVGTLIGSAGKSNTNITHSYVPMNESVKGIGYRYSGTAGDIYTYAPEFVTGFNAYKWTTLDFEEYWAVDEDGTPILQSFAETIPDLSNVEREIDTSWYTKINTYTIKNYKQLLGLHVVSQFDNLSGKIIKLGADIVIQEGDANEWREKAPAIMHKKIGSANVMFAGTFDGCGHSISGVYYKSGTNGGGFFTALGAGSVVRNFRLLNSYIECNQVEAGGGTYSYTGSIAGYAQGTILDRVYSNAIVVNDGEQAGGLVGMMRNGKASIVTNSWFDGQVILHGEKGMRSGGLVGVVWNTTLTVSHCLMSGNISSESPAWGANEGATVGYPNDKATVIIEDTLCTGKFLVKDGKAEGNGMLCGRISATATVTFDDSFALKHKNVQGSEWLSDWGLTGHRDAEPIFTGAAVIMESKYLYGSAGYQYTSLDFENYWDIDPKGYPVLKAFNENEAPNPSNYGKMVDYSWFDSSKETYYISNRRQLMGLSFLSSGVPFKDKTIYQTANITVNSGDAATWETKAPSIKWIPIGNASVMFQGTYNGGGHTISGVYVKEANNGLGLFGCIKDATIKNLKFTNSYIECNYAAVSLAKGKYTNYNYIGGIAGYAAKATFDTIYTDVIVKNDGEMTGGIVGLINFKDSPATLRKCWFDGTIIQDYSIKKKDGSLGACFGAGMIGLLRNNSATIEHCLSTATMRGINVPDGTWGTVSAGFVARIDQTGTNQGGKLTIVDSLANITIEGYPNTIQGNGTVISQANPNTYLKLDNVFAVTNSWKAVGTNRTVNTDQTVETVLLPRMTGANAYMFSTLDFDKYWTALEGKTPELKCFATGTVADPEDAFDDRIADTSWYSDSEDEFIITNVSQMLGFAELSKTHDFAGKTVKLGADIVMNYGTATPNLMDNNRILDGVDPWTPIGTSVTPFRGVFDGQGHTISGLAERASGQSAVFSYVEDAFIQNVTIERSIFRGGSGGGKSAGLVANTAGTTTIKRVKIADSVRLYNATYEGGIVALNSGTLIMDNVWSDIFINPQWSSGAYVGGVLGTNANTAGVSATITNVLSTVEIHGTVAGESFVGGIVGAGGNISATTIKDAVVSADLKVLHGGATGNMYIGSLIGSKSWTGANTVMEDVYATTESGRAYKLDGESTILSGENFGPIRNDQSFASGVTVIDEADLLGELALTNASGLDYENYWLVVDGKVPELINCTSGEPTPAPITEPDKVEKDISWYNNTDTEFVLMDAADLNGFALLSQTNNFAGKTVKLGADIIVNEGDAATWNTSAPEIDWTPIGTQNVPFAGTFDGQGYTISGLYMDDDNAGDAGYGLVGSIKGGTITNIKLVNSAFVRKSTAIWSRSAAIVGTAYSGTISNVYTDAYIYANGQWAGGIVGLQRAAKSGTTVVESELVISNCWYNGILTATSGTTNIGGIIGGAHEGNTADVALTKTTIDNCLFTGHILSDYAGAQAAIGGIFGYTSNTYVSISDSVATGSIVSETNAYVAGSYAYKNWNSKMILSDIYVAEETAKFAFYNIEHNVSGVTTANIKAVAREDLFGDLATTNASGLDFTNTWMTVEENVPVLKAFAGITPIAPIVPEVPAVVPDTSWYDSSKTEFVISTVEELYGLAELSLTNTFSGKTIKLGADITVNTGNAADWATTAPERVWTAISAANTFEGTFDGQYHTISGLYSNNTNNGYAAFIGMAKGATIKNVKIVNSYLKTTINGDYNANTHFHTVAAIIGRVNKGVLVEGLYSDAILVGGRHTGMIGFSDDDASAGVTVKNCWFAGDITTTNAALNSRGSGGIMGQVVNSQVSTFENCLFTGKISGGASGMYVGGIVGIGPYAATIKMTNCLSAGDMSGVTAGTVGSITGNNPGGNSSTYENVFATSETHTNLAGAGADKSSFANVKAVAKAEILGDLAKTKLTAFDFDTIWETVENGVPVLRLEEVVVTPPSDELTADTSWYSDNASEFTIDTAAELLGLVELSQTNNFSGKTIKLGADISLNDGDAADWATTAPENVWTPIGSNATRFAGTIDGQGYTISGLYSKDYAGAEGYNYIALIHSTNNATIKNLKITNTYFAHSNASWAKNTGVLVGCAYGVTVENVYTDAILEGGCFIGMVAMGRSANAISITEAWFDGVITLSSGSANAQVNAGGIFGATAGGNSDTHALTFTDCLFTGTIQGTSNAGTDTNVGGIAGHTSGKMTNVSATNCLVAGTITATGANGPAIGAVYGNTFWKAPAKNFITNVYWTAETYATPIVSSRLGAGQFGNNASLNVADALSEDELLGDLAMTNAPGLDYENVWLTVADKLPELKKLSANNVPAVDPTVETTEWYGDGSATEFTISTVGELKGFVTLSKTNTFSGKTIKLGADIVWNEGDAADWATTAPANVWTPIGNATTQFQGTFDGQNHTVSGLYAKSTNTAAGEPVGFFGATLNNAVIKNVSVVNSYFENGSKQDNFWSTTGIVAFAMNGITLENVYSDAIMTGGTRMGLVGFARNNNTNGVFFKNCWSDITINAPTSGDIRIGGLWGNQDNQSGLTFTVENCLVTATLNGGSATGYAGGVAGNSLNNPYLTMSNTLVDVDINLTNKPAQWFGALTGFRSNTASRYAFTNVYVTNECLQGADGYLFCAGYPDRASTTWTGVTAVATEDILGDLAKTELTGFDFTNTWATNANSTPVLKAFVAFAPEVTPAVDPNEETTEWYGDGSATEFTISTVGELKGFATLSKTNTFSGKTVKLGADIVWNEGDAADWATTAPANVWTPIGTSTTLFQGTFDGQNHTVSGLYTKSTNTAAGEPVGFFGATLNNAVIKNVSVVNSYFENGSKQDNFWSTTGIVAFAMNGITLENVYSDAIMTGGTRMGLVGFARNNNTNGVFFKNCWSDITINAPTSGDIRIGGLWGNQDNQSGLTFTVENCLVTATLNGGSATGYAGGVAGNSLNNPYLTMSNTLVDVDINLTNKPAQWFGALTGFRSNTASRYAFTNVYVTNECLQGADGYLFCAGYPDRASTTWTGVTAVATADILGDLAKDELTGFDFTNTWATNANSTPVLKAFVAFAPEVAPAVDPNEETTEWYGDGSASEFTISTVGELKGFATLSKTNTFSGKTVKLGADIVWNEGDAADWATTAPANAWTPIAPTTSLLFQGTFDGQGHTISGLYCVTNGQIAGLFGAIQNATIKNVNVTNSYFKSGTAEYWDRTGVIGYAYGTTSCTIENIYTDAYMVGGFASGLVAHIRGNINIDNCWNDGNIQASTAKNRVGGIVGFFQNASTATGYNVAIENCLSTVTITGGNASQETMIGGIIGTTFHHYTGITMTNCLSAVDMSGVAAQYIGSVYGHIGGSKPHTITGVYVTNESHSNAIGAGTNYTGAPVKVATADILGDLAKDELTGFDFTNTWATNANSTPVLKAFVAFAPEVDVPVDSNAEDVSWYNNTDTTFTLTTAGQLKGLVTLSKTNTFAGKTIKLGADITLNRGNAADWATTAPAYNWGVIGDSDTTFDGTFDGQGHTISGLYCAFAAGNSMGMFREVKGTVTNFKLVNSYLANTVESDYGYNAAIASYLTNGTVSKVYTNAILETIDSYAGGIVGCTSGTTVTVSECQFDGTLNARCYLNKACDATDGAQSRGHANHVGGIVGAITATNTNINDCVYSGLIINTCNKAHRTGAIVGGTPAANKNVTILRCFSVGGFRADANSYHFSMIMDLRKGDDNTNLTNLATVFTDNYVLTQKLYALDGETLLNSGSNLTGCNKNNGVTVPSTIRYTEAEMIAKIAADKEAGTSNLDFTNVWTYKEGALPTLKAFAN